MLVCRVKRLDHARQRRIFAGTFARSTGEVQVPFPTTITTITIATLLALGLLLPLMFRDANNTTRIPRTQDTHRELPTRQEWLDKDILAWEFGGQRAHTGVEVFRSADFTGLVDALG